MSYNKFSGTYTCDRNNCRKEFQHEPHRYPAWFQYCSERCLDLDVAATTRRRQRFEKVLREE